MEPQYRFCTSADGTRISFSTLGDGPLPTHIIVDGWSFSQEWVWNLPEAFAFYSGIARDCCVVRFDRRGVGTSQRTVDDFSLDAHVADMRAIAEQLGLSTLDLSGASDGASVAIAYAARYPDTIRRLLLWSPYVRGAEVFDPDRMHSVAELMRSDWRLGRRTFAGLVYPRGPLERQRAYGAMLRDAVAPEIAAGYMEFETDVRASLPLIQSPTLVWEPRTLGTAAARASREVAALIPDARRAMTRGDDSMQDWQEQLETAREFLRDDTAGRVAQSPGLRTVLFTDLVGHTEMMQRLGDARGRDVLREHERITRELLRRHEGAEIKTMGDGFMASFASVAAAIDCAIALQRTLAAREGESLPIRVGLNAGEPIEEDGDVFGAMVIMASRVCAQAQAGEILIPEPVRHLLVGKSYVYADRGEIVLKGFERAVRLYEVRWRD